MANILDVINEIGGEELSMRAIATVIGVNPSRMYAIAKKPVAGQMYDPEATNWDAISAYVESKLAEKNFEDMKAFVTAAQEVDAELKANIRRVAVPGANLIEVDGEKVSARKSAKFEMGGENESYICFKHDALVYKMVYQTEGYTVLRPVNSDGTFAMEMLRVVSNGTLNTKCVPPTTLATAIEDRFSGAYAEQLAAEKAKKEAENANQNEAECVATDVPTCDAE